MFGRPIHIRLRATLVLTAAALFNIGCATPTLVQASNASVASNPQSSFQVISTGMKADAYENFGPCPISVGFGGWITTNGSGTVRYTFIRSDGATAPEETLTFEEAGTKMVKTSWTLSRGFKGWQALKILSPNEIESNKAEFSTKCDAPAVDFSVTEIGLKPDRYDYKGPCPMTAAFGGYIRVSAPGTVIYKFIRSDGATSEPKTLRFDKASYAEIRTTWRLGGAGFSNEERWVAIKILSPTEMESNHAKFIVICSPR